MSIVRRETRQNRECENSSYIKFEKQKDAKNDKRKASRWSYVSACMCTCRQEIRLGTSNPVVLRPRCVTFRRSIQRTQQDKARP